MKELEAEPGMHIKAAAELLVKAAQVEDCFLIFNNICLAAHKYSTVNGLLDEYDRLCELSRAEYEASAEGIAAKARNEREIAGLQAHADKLMAKLPHLDFTNLDECINWLCDIEAARDRVGVTVDASKIRAEFQAHGFEAGAYCGSAFVAGDHEIEARWLIGQAIAEQYVPLVRHFASKLA